MYRHPFSKTFQFEKKYMTYIKILFIIKKCLFFYEKTGVAA